MTVHQLLTAIANPGVMGMLCLLGLCLWMFFHPESDDAPKLLLLILGILAFGPLSEAIMKVETDSSPLKFDFFLLLIDKSLGVSAFSLASRLSAGEQAVLFAVYQSLLGLMILWYGLLLCSKNGRARPFLIASILTFVAGPCLYLIVPARGPRHAFGGLFPYGDPVVSPVLIKLDGWPNAMPSLHVATALLFVFFAGRTLTLRAAAWAFLAGTVLSTLAFEHYVIDLVVAAPFACFVTWTAEGRFGRAAAGFALVLAWLLTIRFFSPALIGHPIPLRILAAATVGMSGLYLWDQRGTPAGGVPETQVGGPFVRSSC
jgi:hypothetical protein